MFGKISICAVVAMLAVVNAATAQQQLSAATQQSATIKRTPLQKFDVPAPNHETIIAMAEIVPNVNIGRQTLPGGTSRIYAVEALSK